MVGSVYRWVYFRRSINVFHTRRSQVRVLSLVLSALLFCSVAVCAEIVPENVPESVDPHALTIADRIEICNKEIEIRNKKIVEFQKAIIFYSGKLEQLKELQEGK